MTRQENVPAEEPYDLVGQRINDELENGAEQRVFDRITAIIKANENEMFVGNLLDQIVLTNGYDEVMVAWNALVKMQDNGVVMMYISDGNRYTVGLTRQSS